MTAHLGSRASGGEGYRNWLRATVAIRVQPCLFGPAVTSSERMAAYRDWLEDCVVNRLKPANADVIETALAHTLANVAAVDVHREMVGGIFLQCLPDWLRDEVSTKDPVLASDCGARRVVRFVEGVRVPEADLLKAAATVFDANRRADITDLSGNALVLELSNGSEVLTLRWGDGDGAAHRVEMPHLTLMSADGPARLRVLEEILVELGPSSAVLSKLCREAQSRRLSVEEASLVLRERAKGTVPVHHRLAFAFTHRKPQASGDLVPTEIGYWERFCGPLPEGHDWESYLQHRLIPYRKAFIEQDLKQGLQVCCVGAVRDDLDPGAWVAEFDDDAVWVALAAVQVDGNPISMLGALDVALHRVRDVRFRKYATDTITTLLDGQLGQSNGRDVYRLLQALFDFEMNQLSLVGGMARQAAWWRRMGALMQAGSLSKCLSPAVRDWTRTSSRRHAARRRVSKECSYS